MERTLDRLPSYLRRYCCEHDTSRYTARDHAAWRYIMRRAVDFFKDNAVHTYMPGLKKTGLQIDRIPHIDEIDQALQEIGWGAVPVVGFIAPWAFIEFQARKILPIATDMRSANHIAYTPAPDIVHEAAGHAPILPDKDYSDYLAYYASLGCKAIYSRQDLEVYEAVRYLSDIKEKPDSTPEAIARAELNLQKTMKNFSYTSEQALVARMSWWTAEYGMAGSLEIPKIYGAGLLSSVGESKMAMTDKVKKLRLSLDCINYSYNITEPQPQLFVAESMQHLHDVLHELDAKLAYRRGGLEALQKALDCQAITSTCLDTQLTVSGRLVEYLHQGERVDFLKFAGPVQLSVGQKQLSGHGIERHPNGFSSPIGRLQNRPEQALTTMTDRELQELGIQVGKRTKLHYVSGFTVEGYLTQIHRQQNRILYMTFNDCLVKKGQAIYFEPSWGEFDLIVGDSVPSIYGGPADRESFGEQEITQTETTPARDTPYNQDEWQTFHAYQKLRDWRQLDPLQFKQNTNILEEIDALSLWVLQTRPEEWLLQLELYELMQSHFPQHCKRLNSFQTLDRQLHLPTSFPLDSQDLIQEGLRLVH